ncbi:unnamed protein product [Moneuplotes crassus]|uniref:Uncharacterized protein n=1 Tax=Euplotes crassus TaxID=5936 RepID=A0AAD1U134_EUPCR|nr:unnamed protein product [Moneuplotes crassus]
MKENASHPVILDELTLKDKHNFDFQTLRSSYTLEQSPQRITNVKNINKDIKFPKNFVEPVKPSSPIFCPSLPREVRSRESSPQKSRNRPTEFMKYLSMMNEIKPVKERFTSLQVSRKSRHLQTRILKKVCGINPLESKTKLNKFNYITNNLGNKNRSAWYKTQYNSKMNSISNTAKKDPDWMKKIIKTKSIDELRDSNSLIGPIPSRKNHFYKKKPRNKLKIKYWKKPAVVKKVHIDDGLFAVRGKNLRHDFSPKPAAQEASKIIKNNAKSPALMLKPKREIKKTVLNIPKFYEKKDIEFCLDNFKNFIDVKIKKHNVIEKLQGSKPASFGETQEPTEDFCCSIQESNEQEFQTIYNKQSHEKPSNLKVSANSSGIDLRKEILRQSESMKINIENNEPKQSKESRLNKDLDIICSSPGGKVIEESKENKFYMNYAGIQPFVVTINHSPLSSGNLEAACDQKDSEKAKPKSRCECVDPDFCTCKYKQDAVTKTLNTNVKEQRKVLRLKKPEINICEKMLCVPFQNSDSSRITSPNSFKGRKLNQAHRLNTKNQKIHPLSPNSSYRNTKSTIREPNFHDLFSLHFPIDKDSDFKKIREKTEKLLFPKDLSL